MRVDLRRFTATKTTKTDWPQSTPRTRFRSTKNHNGDGLNPLLRLKYHNSIADAVTDLGKPDEIGRVFTGFQKYLYQPQAAA